MDDITADELDEQYTADELRSGPATEFDITGRWDMTKPELIDAIIEAQHERLDGDFADVYDVEEGDIVQMNHLQSNLEVTEVAIDGEDIDVVLATNRGGFHKFCYRVDGNSHLCRWRAGDQSWMKNSDDPMFFEIVED